MPRVTIEEQADWLEQLLARTRMHSGQTATSTTMFLSSEDVAFADGIVFRLRAMAPHEERIRKVVTGR